MGNGSGSYALRPGFIEGAQISKKIGRRLDEVARGRKVEPGHRRAALERAGKIERRLVATEHPRRRAEPGRAARNAIRAAPAHLARLPRRFAASGAFSGRPRSPRARSRPAAAMWGRLRGRRRSSISSP